MNGLMQEDSRLFDDSYINPLDVAQQQNTATNQALPGGQANTQTTPGGALSQATQRYFERYPDIAQAYAQNNYGLTADQFAQTHYDRYGQAEGRLFNDTVTQLTTDTSAADTIVDQADTSQVVPGGSQVVADTSQASTTNLGAQVGALDLAQVSADAADDPAVAAQNPLLTEYSTAQQMVTPFKPTAVVFGDSMSGAVGYNPADNTPDIKYGVTVADVLANNLGVDVFNLASGGETSNEALNPIGKHGGFENYITKYQPQYAILRYGAADAIRNKDGIQNTIDSITKMVDIAQRNGTTPVIVGVSELYSTKNSKTGFIIDYIDPGAEERANQINSFLKNLAIQKGLPFIDVRSLVQAGENDLFDGVHANVEFGKKMADAISGAISSLGIIPGAKQFSFSQGQAPGALTQVTTPGGQQVTPSQELAAAGTGALDQVTNVADQTAATSQDLLTGSAVSGAGGADTSAAAVTSPAFSRQGTESDAFNLLQSWVSEGRSIDEAIADTAFTFDVPEATIRGMIPRYGLVTPSQSQVTSQTGDQTQATAPSGALTQAQTPAERPQVDTSSPQNLLQNILTADPDAASRLAATRAEAFDRGEASTFNDPGEKFGDYTVKALPIAYDFSGNQIGGGYTAAKTETAGNTEQLQTLGFAGKPIETTMNYDDKGNLVSVEKRFFKGGDSGIVYQLDPQGNIISGSEFDYSEAWKKDITPLVQMATMAFAPYLGDIGAFISGLPTTSAVATGLGGALVGGAGAALTGQDVIKGAALGGLGGAGGELAKSAGQAAQTAVGPGIAGDVAGGLVRGAVGALPSAIATGDVSNIVTGGLTGGLTAGVGTALQDLGLSPQQIQGAATIVTQLASGNPNVNSMINAAGQLADSPDASIAAKAAVMVNLFRTGAPPQALVSAASDLANTISAAEQYKTDKAMFEAVKGSRVPYPSSGPTEKDVFESVAREQTMKIGAGEADDLQQASALAQSRGFNRFEFPAGSGTTYTAGDVTFTDPESQEVIRTNREGIELADANRRFMEEQRQSKLPDYSSADSLSSAAMKAYTEGNTGTFMYKGSEYRAPDAIDIATGKATALPIVQGGIPSITVGGGATTPPAPGGTFTAPDIPIPPVTIDYGGVPIDYSAVSPESGTAATETIRAQDVADQGPIKADQTVEVVGKRLNEFERWSDYIDKYFPGGGAQKDSFGNIQTPPTFEEWQAMGGRTQPAGFAQIGSDLIKSVAAGAADVAKAPFVLANLIAGKSSSGITESLASYINSVEQSMSPEFKADKAQMEKLLGTDPSVWQTLKAYGTNPQQALNFLARTSPTMLAGGAAGLGARLIGAGVTGIEAAAILANAGVHGAQSADSAMEQARQLGYSDAQSLSIGRTVAALSSMISAGAQKIVPGAMSIEAKIAGTNVPALIGRETGEAMLSTGQSALKNALVRYGGEITSENIEEGSSRIMTNLAVGRPWDEGLSRTFVEATLASGGITAAVDAISKIPAFDSLLTQAQADPEGKDFADLIFLGRSTPTLTTFESGPPAIGMDVPGVDPNLAEAPDLLTGQQQLLTDQTGSQVATGAALDEQIAKENRVSDIVGDRTSTAQAPTSLPPGASPDMVAFFDEKGTPVTYRDLGLTQPATQPPTTDQATKPVADQGVIDVETKPITTTGAPATGGPAVSPAADVSGQQVSVAERSVELDNLQKLFDQALFETSAPGVSISNGAVTDVTTDPTTNTNITQVVNPITGQTQVTITDTNGNPATSTAVVGTDTTGNPVTAGTAQSIVSGQTTGSVVVGNTTIASTVDPNTNTSTVVKTDSDTGVRTETVVDSNSGTTTKTVTDPTTNTATQVVTDVAAGTTTVVQSTTDTATKVETNTATNVSTVTTTDINTGTTTQTVTDPATNQTVKTETTNNATTQVVTDPDTNLTTTTKTNTNTGVTTQTTVDPGTNTTTQVTTNPNTNTTIVTVTDPASGLEATTQIDLNTGTQTTLIVDTNTGAVVNQVTGPATDTVQVDPVTPVEPVTSVQVEKPDASITQGPPTTEVQQPPVTPTTPKKPTTTPPNITIAPALATALGAGAPGDKIGPQFLKSWETQKYQDPLAQVKQAQAELQTDNLMQSIDPRLAAILQERLGADQKEQDESIGALARLLSGEKEPEEPANAPYYSYGKEDSIDSILGGKAVGFAEGGYVAPLQMADGGMTLPLMAKEGGRPREDFRDGKHVAGDGDGQSDDIPAWLADGEFVFPADVVSALGNGSTKAGTDKLYEMMHEIRKRARSTDHEDLPPAALKSPLDYLKSKK